MNNTPLKSAERHNGPTTMVLSEQLSEALGDELVISSAFDQGTFEDGTPNPVETVGVVEIDDFVDAISDATDEPESKNILKRTANNRTLGSRMASFKNLRRLSRCHRALKRAITQARKPLQGTGWQI